MRAENLEVSKQARREEILKKLAEIDQEEKSPNYDQDEGIKRKSALERELAELDGVPFS